MSKIEKEVHKYLILLHDNIIICKYDIHALISVFDIELAFIIFFQNKKLVIPTLAQPRINPRMNLGTA